MSSEVLRGEFINKFNTDRNKCITILLTIDVHKYKPKPLEERENIILFIDGRRRRNLGFALEVFKHVKSIVSDVKLIVIGRVEDIKVNGVEYVGYIPRDRLRELYSKAMVLLTPSGYEGFGYPAIEASASGTPTVGSNAIPQEVLVDGVNGFRIPIFNPKVYVTKLVELIKNDELWGELHRKCIEHAKQIHIDKIINEHLKLCSYYAKRRYIQLYDRK